MKTAEYRLIPISEITDKAREIAVAWIDNYVPHGSIMPEIAQKQKLASDIMNYAFEYSSEKDKEIERLKKEMEEFKNMVKEMRELQKTACYANSIMRRIKLQNEVDKIFM